MSNTKSNKNQRKNNRGGDGQKNAGQNGGSKSSGSAGGGRNPNEKGRQSNRRRKSSRKKKVDPKVFWGDPDLLAEVPEHTATITTNPSAVVLSLGRPPLSGQQNASEHYFTAVYARAVNLAAALAAAGNLVEPEELTG